jgi:hypothetical protein
MHLLDPNRPTVAGSPAYIDKEGKPIAVVQRPMFEYIGLKDLPYILGGNIAPHWRVSVFLMIDHGQAAEFSCEIHDPVGFLCWYAEDPEAVLRDVFNYTFDPKFRQPKASEIERGQGLRDKPTIEELGF